MFWVFFSLLQQGCVLLNCKGGEPQKKPPFRKIEKWYLTELFSMLTFILQHYLLLAMFAVPVP